MEQSKKSRTTVLNTVLLVLVGQVGCLTLVIILASVLGGMWLDSTFGTRPVFTLILMLAGVPISIFLMLSIARRTITKITANSNLDEQKHLPED